MKHTAGPPERGPFLRMLARSENALSAVSVVAMAAIMLIVVVDVMGRYFFSAPLTWSYNLIGLYLMTAVFFMALPGTLSAHGHIAVDILQHNLPRWLMHTGLFLGYGMSTVLMALITWGTYRRLVPAWLHDDRIQALVPFPTWVPYTIAVIGCTVMVIRCLVRTIGHAASAVTGRELVDVPLPPEKAAVAAAEAH